MPIEPTLQPIHISLAGTVELPSALVGVLIAASFDGAIAAVNRGARAAVVDIHDACSSAVQAMTDQATVRRGGSGLSADAPVVVCSGSDGHDHETTWGAFCADNRDALSSLDLPLIVSTLARGATFAGGGGAEGEWTLRRA